MWEDFDSLVMEYKMSESLILIVWKHFFMALSKSKPDGEQEWIPMTSRPMGVYVFL